MTTALAGGRYALGPVVGSGGMAQVRRATDTLLGREVAVKMFREDLDEVSAARARDEMQTLAGLAHPNLVAVHDAGTVDGSQPFLVMELVEGPTLAECCQAGSLSPDQLQDIGAGLADALAYVHSRGVVHRDVKPANVLLSPSGAKLADFGIARIVDGARHTGVGLTVGTAPYLAPEQVTGEPVGPAADIYALGLVLLECLTGHREFTGGAVEAAMARVHRQPSVPSDLPEPWTSLLTAMTARKPADRPSAEDVALALRVRVTAVDPYPDRGGTEDTQALSVSPQATQVLTPVPEPVTTTVPTPVPTTVPTPAPTSGQAPGQASGQAPGAATPPTRIARVVAPPPARRRRPPVVVLASLAVLAVVLLAVGVAAFGGAPEPARTPLEQHISELQDAVSR